MGALPWQRRSGQCQCPGCRARWRSPLRRRWLALCVTGRFRFKFLTQALSPVSVKLGVTVTVTVGGELFMTGPGSEFQVERPWPLELANHRTRNVTWLVVDSSLVSRKPGPG